MMTFRVEDLTVSLLPDGYGIEDAADKCTKCTKRTGPPTECSNPSEQGCECCGKSSESPTKKRSLSDGEIAMLHAQIDELLASL
jgi:hypothetical protein